ncbi:uncharacterized protein LOC124342469 [Daphnia pulicaria]|uniref:uncharacterized protein LOC124342469 n=1 Tax=Daphnia pulicaria TaxID=35523 RepID=UPI001EEB66FD|nr:uncharacterized protein LOC124342469 [Daphnia pulicaria]
MEKERSHLLVVILVEAAIRKSARQVAVLVRVCLQVCLQSQLGLFGFLDSPETSLVSFPEPTSGSPQEYRIPQRGYLPCQNLHHLRLSSYFYGKPSTRKINSRRSSVHKRYHE